MHQELAAPAGDVRRPGTDVCGPATDVRRPGTDPGGPGTDVRRALCQLVAAAPLDAQAARDLGAHLIAAAHRGGE